MLNHVFDIVRTGPRGCTWLSSRWCFSSSRRSSAFSFPRAPWRFLAAFWPAKGCCRSALWWPWFRRRHRGKSRRLLRRPPALPPLAPPTRRPLRDPRRAPRAGRAVLRPLRRPDRCARPPLAPARGADALCGRRALLRFRTFFCYTVLGGVVWSTCSVMIGYLRRRQLAIRRAMAGGAGDRCAGGNHRGRLALLGLGRRRR